jgi:hypothetical protein
VRGGSASGGESVRGGSASGGGECEGEGGSVIGGACE